MKIPKIHYIYISAIVIISIISLVISIKIFDTSTDELILSTVTVLSLVVSVFAFIIAFSTYLSIDSVNNITQMEGNVLENEHYITSITSLLNQYKTPDSTSASNEILRDLERLFSKKKSKTAIEFADNLQTFIDLIVLFPALFRPSDTNREENRKRMDKILLLIQKRKQELQAISTGNLTLIEETVKLINGVMRYQKLINSGDYKVEAKLLEVRGTMLRNTVTKTVYYNYLGLFYNKKAMNILVEHLNLNVRKIYEIATFEKIMNDIHTLPEKDTELAIMYFQESKDAFQKAIENCKDDVMWNGFIKYNDARTTFFLSLFAQNGESEDWTELMNEAIVARSKLNSLIADVLEQNENHVKTHLQKEFHYQEFLARLIKMNILIASRKDITNTRNISKYFYPEYLGLEDDTFVSGPYEEDSDGVKNFQQGIQHFIASNRG